MKGPTHMPDRAGPPRRQPTIAGGAIDTQQSASASLTDLTVRSRSGALEIALSPSATVTITMVEEGSVVRDEELLAEEVEDTIKQLWQKYRARLPPVPDHYRIVHGRHWHENYLDKVSRIYSEAVSEEGLVQVELYGDGELLVTFHSNSVRRTDIPKQSLIAQLNEAYRSASRKYSKQLSEIRGTYKAEFIASRQAHRKEVPTP